MDSSQLLLFVKLVVRNAARVVVNQLPTRKVRGHPELLRKG